MNERPLGAARHRPERSRWPVRRPVGIALAIAASSATVLLNADHVSGGDRYVGPLVYVSPCAELSESPPIKLQFSAHHEPGEIHRYRWRLDIDGAAVVGGMVELADKLTDWDHGWYEVPPHLYPVIVGAEYRLSVQDGFDPDRLEVVTKVVEECPEDPHTTIERG